MNYTEIFAQYGEGSCSMKPPYLLYMWQCAGTERAFWGYIQQAESIEEAEQIATKMCNPIPNRYKFHLYMGRDYGYQEILCKE